MKRFCTFKLMLIVSFLTIALVFVGFNLVQAQGKSKDKKPKPPPPQCNNNGICEYDEYDSKKSHEDQPCADCLPKIYNPLYIEQTGLQIASARHIPAGELVKVFQFKCVGVQDINGTIVGAYEDTWASTDLPVNGYSCIGDIDNDGEKEIVAVANYLISRKKGIKAYNHKIIIFESYSDGNPSWESPYFGNSPGAIADCQIADVDNDGNEEIVMIKGRHIEIYRIIYDINTGSYSFNHVWTGPEYSATVWRIDVGDADNLGDNEIVLATFSEDAPVIWKKTNTGWVEKIAEPISSFGVDVVKVRNTDNIDGNEIIVGGNNNKLTIWQYNPSSMTYDSVYISQDLGGFTQGIDAGDINGDGENEIVIGASGYKLYVLKYINDIYQIMGEFSFDGFSGDISVGNLDSDDRDEIVIQLDGMTIFDFENGMLIKSYNSYFGSNPEVK